MVGFISLFFRIEIFSFLIIWHLIYFEIDTTGRRNIIKNFLCLLNNGHKVIPRATGAESQEKLLYSLLKMNDTKMLCHWSLEKEISKEKEII